MALPFVVYSDGPRLPTGLARIARDLMTRLYEERDTLGLDLLQVGFDPLPGLAPAWPVWSFAHMDMGEKGDWGADAIDEAWDVYFARRGVGVLFSVWDPGRSFSLLPLQGPANRWGYFPIDGANVNDSLGGPAREAIARFDRVLAYGRWGSQVLATIRRPVPYLPHGLDLRVWDYHVTPDALARAEQLLQMRAGEVVIGCVATNQARKDLGLYFGTLAELRHRGHKVRGWLHTDKLVRHWSVQQLIEDFGLARKVSVTTSLQDWELAACYACCGATIAPGLGEGFGFPIVESLACGTPCIHGDAAGGAELVPLNAWRIPRCAERLEGLYALRRPVFNPVDAANAIERALDWKRNDERTCQVYCRGQVEYLSWTHLWPRWRKWFQQGLEEL